MENSQEMASGQLKSIIEKAKVALLLVAKETDLEDWVDSKITIAEEYLETVCDYLAYHDSEVDEFLDDDDTVWEYEDSEFGDWEEDLILDDDRLAYNSIKELYKQGKYNLVIQSKKKRPKGKKWKHTYKDKKTGRKKTVWHGDSSEKTSPGTSRGDSYCARSWGIAQEHNQDCSGKDKNTPNCLSRKRWKCKGKKSSK